MAAALDHPAGFEMRQRFASDHGVHSERIQPPLRDAVGGIHRIRVYARKSVEIPVYTGSIALIALP